MFDFESGFHGILFVRPLEACSSSFNLDNNFNKNDTCHKLVSDYED